MTSFIRCPECGYCIGKYMEFIDAAKQAVYEKEVFSSDKYSSYSPEKMVFDASVTPSLECLFDAVGIDNPCCRMHITSKTNFNKLYK